MDGLCIFVDLLKINKQVCLIPMQHCSRDQLRCNDFHNDRRNVWVMTSSNGWRHSPTHCFGFPNMHERSASEGLLKNRRLSINRYGLVLHGARLDIPDNINREIISRIHNPHCGIGPTNYNAQQAIWFPGIISDIANTTQYRETCHTMRLSVVVKKSKKNLWCPSRPLLLCNESLTLVNRLFIWISTYWCLWNEYHVNKISWQDMYVFCN